MISKWIAHLTEKNFYRKNFNKNILRPNPSSKVGSLKTTTFLMKTTKNKILTKSRVQQMVLAKCLASNDIIKKKTVQVLKDDQSESIITRAIKGEKFVAMSPVYKKKSITMGDKVLKLSNEKKTLKIKFLLIERTGHKKLKENN